MLLLPLQSPSLTRARIAFLSELDCLRGRPVVRFFLERCDGHFPLLYSAWYQRLNSVSSMTRHPVLSHAKRVLVSVACLDGGADCAILEAAARKYELFQGPGGNHRTGGRASILMRHVDHQLPYTRRPSETLRCLLPPTAPLNPCIGFSSFVEDLFDFLQFIWTPQPTPHADG